MRRYGGRSGAKMLAGPIDHPQQLGDDLVRCGEAAIRRPVSCSKIHGLPSEPRAIITASAPDCDVRVPGALRGRAARPRRSPGAGRPPGAAPARGRARTRARPCAGWRRGGDARRSPRRPASATSRSASSIPERSPGSRPERSFTVTGLPEPVRGRAGHAHRQVGVGEQRRAGPRLADLAHGAAHVDVDQVGAGRRPRSQRPSASRPGRARTAGSRPGARPGGRRAARAGCARCGGEARSSRPSPRPPCRHRGGAPADARTSLPMPASGASKHAVRDLDVAYAERRR